MSMDSKKRPSFQMISNRYDLPAIKRPIIDVFRVEQQLEEESSVEEDVDENHNNIPAAVVRILKDCRTPDKAMQEILMEGLISSNQILPCEEAKVSERLKGRLTADQIAEKLRKKCSQ